MIRALISALRGWRDLRVHEGKLREARRKFAYAFPPKPEKPSPKAHVRTKLTLTQAELQERVHDALRRKLSA